jgi:integrase
MARKPKLNWTPCFNQYTCTVNGTFHRLGKDEKAAKTQFDFLLKEAERGKTIDPNVTFVDVADAFLDHVEEHHTPERYRHCKERLQEFKDVVGDSLRVRELEEKHVDKWLKTKGTLTAGTERLYKSIVLSCLNWAAKKGRGGGQLIAANPLKGQLHLPQGESRGKEAVWTQEVYDQVLEVSSPAFCDLVKILAWTGARMTTVIKIEARHYNKLQSRWDCEELSRGRKRVKYVRLVNDEARELVERLNALRPSGPIFLNAKGDPWEPDAPQIYLFNLKHKFLHSKKLEWPDGLCMKGLRHTFASNFLRQFPNEIEYLRVLLGHADYKMVLKHYNHLIDMDAAAFKRIEGFKPLT